MINNDKWINSLPNTNSKQDHELLQIDHDKWINTIPKRNTFNSVKKYSTLGIIFVCGLIFVSVVKNETRTLEKEINYLKASINLIEFNLNQAILDNEVITSPENLSKLAKEYLDSDLVYYKKSQIKNLNGEHEVLQSINKENNPKIIGNLPEKVKDQLTSRIPMARLGNGDDVSNCVAFLSSETTSYVTGETIHVNGGMYMA